MPKGFRISSIAAESLKFVTICAVTASIQILDYFGCRQRQHKVATFKQTDGEAALSATGKNILQRNNNEQFFNPLDIIGRGSSHNIEVGPWHSKSVPCIQHSWTKKSPIKVQEDARDDIECIHWDVYVVADVVQLILCCSALNCAAAAADSRVTQLTNMQTKTET